MALVCDAIRRDLRFSFCRHVQLNWFIKKKKNIYFAILQHFFELFYVKVQQL